MCITVVRSISELFTPILMTFFFHTFSLISSKKKFPTIFFLSNGILFGSNLEYSIWKLIFRHVYFELKIIPFGSKSKLSPRSYSLGNWGPIESPLEPLDIILLLCSKDYRGFLRLSKNLFKKILNLKKKKLKSQTHPFEMRSPAAATLHMLALSYLIFTAQ